MPAATILPELPVSKVLPDLLQVLETGGSAVLVAPPGAGKTTLVPLALLAAPWLEDGRRIILLEPRRLAARAAARRMASLLDEQPGGTVGYAMRMENLVSERTRILVVTEGVLARMILDDPELSGVAALVFDEFHERSLDGDFGLALALDVQAALRPDLKILVMSATLDAARVSKLLAGAPVIESAGRSFPVDIVYRERKPEIPVEDAVAGAIRAALADEAGSLLAFLPGQREIERTADRLAGVVPADADIVPLYGLLDGRAQDMAIRPAPPGRRKIVLATAIAETSITIDGVRVVVDSGLARLPSYEPSSGLTRLETVRVSRASADQRAGRAGRTGPGVAIRLWRAEQTAALSSFTPPEILAADLSGLVLDCAAFGVADPGVLSFLDPPPPAALAEARALLLQLDAIDAVGRITANGKSMRRLALPARLAHMVAEAATGGRQDVAAKLAVLLTERGLGGTAADLERRLSVLRGDRSPRATAARNLASRLARAAKTDDAASSLEQVTDRPAVARGVASAGALLLHAWPDRVAKARGGRGRFLLANGSGARIDETDPLAGEMFLVVADLQGRAQEARIVAAAPVSESEIRNALADRIETVTEIAFDREKRAIRVREVVRLGAIVLAERMLPPPAGAAADRAIVAALRRHGLSLLTWGRNADNLRHRLSWLNRGLGPPWPDVSDTALLSGLEDWLLPFLSGEASFAAIDAETVHQALMSLVPHYMQRQVPGLAPTHFEAPSGSHVPIRYDGEWPVLSIRVQELFGLAHHPSIAGGTVPLTLELLSPAHRPIQTTRDLPGFWHGSWAEVRAEMRGRYPRHSWPDDPLHAEATSRARPRSK